MQIVCELKNFPASICTRDLSSNIDDDKLYDASIIEDDGLIKFVPEIPLEEIYIEQHNASNGIVWSGHNTEFSNFIKSHNPSKVLEIAGGSGNIAFNLYKDINWRIIDLNPEINLDIKVLQKEFEFTDVKDDEWVVCSHFVEHLSNQKLFFEGLRARNTKGIFFSIPNLIEYVKHRFPAIHFEHPTLVTEEYIEYILSITGWSIVQKEFYNNHSIFYYVVPMKSVDVIFCNNNTALNLMHECLESYKNRIDKIKNNKFYFFGAHFVYYYYRSLGMNEKNVLGVIDNDPKKQNRRMFGSNITTLSIDSVPKGSKILVDMGPYHREIVDRLKSNFSII